MNKKQKLQVTLAALCVVYIIIWLLFPGWKGGKILGILSGVSTLIAIYIVYRAEKKKNAD